jgi:hypothetical protein
MINYQSQGDHAMKRICVMAVAVFLTFLMPACDNGGSKGRAASLAVAKTKVTVNEIKKTVKTAKGTPMRIFEVTPDIPVAPASEMPPPPRGVVLTTSNKSLVAVVGDASVPVEIIDAHTATIGGKKVRLDLMVIGPAVVLVSATHPANGVAVRDISVDDALKKIDGGVLDIPAADTLP